MTDYEALCKMLYREGVCDYSVFGWRSPHSLVIQHDGLQMQFVVDSDEKLVKVELKDQRKGG